MATQIIENKGLSELAKQNLERNEEIRRSMGDSRYIKLQDQQDIVLQFDAEKMESVQKDSKWQAGKKTTQFNYTVIDPEEPFKERIITFSGRWSEQIDALLRTGEGVKRLLRIKRLGLEKNTVYIIEAA